MKNQLTIGFMLIATGKYKEFVKPFIESAERYFLPNIEKYYFLFTDDCSKSYSLIYADYFIEHLPFPLPTLLRFHRFLQNQDSLSQHDYLVYSDVDNLWVNLVEPEEVLSPLSATLHCGYINGGTDFDQNPKSLAYLSANGTEGYKYYAGGFILATPQEYFRMAKWCAKRINEDMSHNVIAKWHDESHLNKYLNTIRKPERELTPSFHFAEYLQKNDVFREKYPPKLLLLNKNHEEIRKIEY